MQSIAIFLVPQKLTGEASRDHKSKVVERYRAG